jgi:hypothetical protein
MASSASDPPSYETSRQNPASVSLSTTEPLSLVVNGTHIYLSSPPSQALYELTRPLDGSGKITGIQQIGHKISAGSCNDPIVISHERLLYEFRPWHERESTMEVKGKRKSCCETVWIQRSLGLRGHTWSVQVKDLKEKSFTVRQNFQSLFQDQKSLEWKDESGRLVAIEVKSRVETGREGTSLPRLDIRAVLDEKQLNLLVTAWCARIWQEAMYATKESMRCTDGEYFGLNLVMQFLS